MEELNKSLLIVRVREGRKYLAAKNVIYTIVKHAWDSVSFLNPQTKEKDVYKDFEQYFIAPVLEYLESDKSLYKLTSCSCENPVKNASETLSFLNKTGFDVNRKNSHAWDFVNDLIICPVCKLIYACIPVVLRTYTVKACLSMPTAVSKNYYARII